MQYYLFRYVDRTPDDDDPTRQLTPPTFQQQWTTLQFVPDPTRPMDGFGILAVEQRDADVERESGSVYLGDDLADETGGRLLLGKAGLNFKGRGGPKVRDAILDLFVEHSTPVGDKSRWNGLTPVMPTGRGERARYEVWLGNQVVAAVPVVSGGATFTESFNKANSTTLGPDLTWTEEVVGNVQVLSNVCDVVTTGSLNWATSDTAAATDNNYGQGVITGTDTTSTTIWAVTARGTSGSSTYYGRQGDATSVNNTNLQSWIVGFSDTSIASGTHTKADGDVIKITSNGTTQTLLFNGSSNLTVTNSALTTGKRCGVALRAAATGRAKLDSFEGGDISTPSPPFRRRRQVRLTLR